MLPIEVVRGILHASPRRHDHAHVDARRCRGTIRLRAGPKLAEFGMASCHQVLARLGMDIATAWNEQTLTDALNAPR